MSTRRTPAAPAMLAAALAAMLVLAACEAGSDPVGGAGSAAPVEETGSPGPVDGSADDPGGEDAEPAESAPEPEALPRPEACDGVRMAGDRQYTGAELSTCLTALFLAWGTGREYMDDGTVYGDVEFVYTDELRSFDVELHGDATGRLRVIGEDSWFDGGGGWQPDEVMGPLYAALSSPEALSEVVAPGSTWTVQRERELVTLPDGEDVEAWAVVLDEGYALGDVTVEAWTLWFADDVTPVGNSGTSAIWGTSATSTQIFYDLGADIVIEPPA